MRNRSSRIAMTLPSRSTVSFSRSANISQSCFSGSGWSGSEAVSHDSLSATVPLQRLLHDGQSYRFISLFRHIGFEDLTLVVHRTPNSPSSFTYISSRCQRQCRKPFIYETRRRLISPANIGPNRFRQKRTVSWQMSIPSSTS